MTFLSGGWSKSAPGVARCDESRARPQDAANPDAATLHARYLDDVFRYAARRVARREDAEDIAAEVFAAAFQALPRFRGDVEPRLWLLGIARRKVADALRHKRVRQETSWDDAAWDEAHAEGADEPARAVARSEARREMRQLLATLKDEQREALLLKYVEELSIEEIAVVMGRSKAAANSLLQRARATAFRQGRAYFLDQSPLGDDEVTS